MSAPPIYIFSVHESNDNNSFHINAIIMTPEKNELIKTQPLVNSGTGGTFIDQNYSRKQGFNLMKLEYLIMVMSTPDALPTEIALIALLLFKFQVYSTSLRHYYHRPVTLSTFRLLYQSTIHHMASINALRLPLKKFFCP
jgi:hypothetical protein